MAALINDQRYRLLDQIGAGSMASFTVRLTV
jgi:hypothetical protein